MAEKDKDTIQFMYAEHPSGLRKLVTARVVIDGHVFTGRDARIKAIKHVMETLLVGYHVAENLFTTGITVEPPVIVKFSRR